MMKRLAMAAMAMMVAAGGTALGQVAAGASAPMTAAGGESYAVENGQMKLRGQTAPALKVEVPSVLRGQLSEVDVKEGDVVKKGDVIAKLDDKLQEGAVQLAKLAAENDAAVQYAEADIKFADNELQRVKELGTNANASELHQKELALTKAQITLVNEKSLLEQNKVKLLAQQTTLEQMTIRSPIDGQVYRLKKHAGEETDETPVAVVVQTSKLNVLFYLPGSLFGRVKAGEKVSLSVEMEPKAVMREAVVTNVDPVVDPTGLFQVTLQMDNGDGSIPAGVPAVWARDVKAASGR